MDELADGRWLSLRRFSECRVRLFLACREQLSCGGEVMIACSICGKQITPRSKSGKCRPCWLQSDCQPKRLATLAAQTSDQRIARFQVQLGINECWGWTGAQNGVGYGVIRIHGHIRLATHVSLELDGRPRPSSSHVACHACDNPICTNPKHLWWGTEKENMQDAVTKGRMTNRKRRAGGAPCSVKPSP